VLCDYWWAILLALVLGLAAYFTRGYWLPAPRPPEPTRVAALGTGDVQVTLIWNSYNDLDLYVTDPAGDTIFWLQPTSPSGGQLDVDANYNCIRDMTANPVENIFWLAAHAPQGDYAVGVKYYQNCPPAPMSESYTVRVLVDGNVQEFTGTVSTIGQIDLVTTIRR
jgi:uncharacterized protein YfaP (DUF2135 family)